MKEPQPTDERQTDIFAWTPPPRQVIGPLVPPVVSAPVAVIEPEPETPDEEPVEPETRQALLDEELTPIAPGLFSAEEIEPWRREWQNMPEYNHEDMQARYQILVSFATKSDVIEFARCLGRDITPRNGRQTQSIWFPEAEIGRFANKRYKEAE